MTQSNQLPNVPVDTIESVDESSVTLVDDDGEQYEYGDSVTHDVIHTNTSDLSPLQFVYRYDDHEHVKLLIEIAKNICSETVDATVSMVAAKLLRGMSSMPHSVAALVMITESIFQALFCHSGDFLLLVAAGFGCKF